MDRLFQWGGIVLLAFASSPRALRLNLLGAATFAYVAWQLVSGVFLSPVYAAEGIYRPLMLLGGFAAISTLRRDQVAELFGAGVALLVALVLLGLLQHFLGLWNLDFAVWRLQDNPVRAAATFVTPNSFATAINMFLVPMAGLYLLRGQGRSFALAMWLFAGLVATQSRGGMLAFLAGLGFVAVCLGLPALRRNQERVLRLLAGCLVVWIAVGAAGMFSDVFDFGGSAREASATAPWFGRGMAERPELYAATLDMIREHPWAGYGANMFYPLFESVKPAWLASSEYSYVHNDYLQAWLEYGAPGLAMLLFLATASLVGALRAHRRVPMDPVPLACGAALAACFAHAVVDFPLYIPFILLLVGGYLGALAAHQGDRATVPAATFVERAFDASPPIRWALALAALLWLAQPMLAELAVYRSITVLERGDARNGLYWQAVARRLEPRYPAHYWAEGTIWRAQALISSSPLLAAKADELFAGGMQADPYDVANLLGRMEMHRRHAGLMNPTAPRAQILSWAERAAALRPQNLTVQAEVVRTFAHSGERERAHLLAHALLAQYPASNLARRLAADY